MRRFNVFEQTIASAVYGLIPGFVEIMNVSLMPSARRLRHSNSEAVPPKPLPPRRPPPAPRWLQARDKYEPVPPPTPLEAPGAKHDGKAGGLKTDRMKVHFSIFTAYDAEIPFRVLREFERMDQGAMTGTMLDIMARLNPPLTYVVAIVNASVEPVTVISDDRAGNAAAGIVGPSAHSSAFSQFGPVLLYSVRMKPFVIVGTVVASTIAFWL